MNKFLVSAVLKSQQQTDSLLKLIMANYYMPLQPAFWSENEKKLPALPSQQQQQLFLPEGK